MTEEKFLKSIYIRNIEYLRDSKKMKKGKFCKYIGIANLYRKDSTMPGDKVLRLIQERFPHATKEWLFTDHGVKYLTENGKNEDAIRHPQPEYNVSAKQLPHPDPLSLTARVLNTDSVYRTALESNIKAFHDAVAAKEELAIAEAKLAQANRDNIELKQQINEKNKMIERLKSTISELRAGKSGNNTV